MKNFFKFLATEFLYNGHFQTLGSVGIALFSAIILDIKISLLSLVILYISFYLIYLFNRYREVENDYLTNQKRSVHINSMIRFIPIIIIVLSILLISLLLFTNLIFATYILTITIFGFLYTTYFKKVTRSIFLFKNFYVALVFAILVFFPIFYNAATNFSDQAIFLAILVFLKAVAMQIFLDLKDVEGDKKDELKTLGVVLGKKKALSIFKVLVVISSGVLPIIYFLWGIFSMEILVLIFMIPINFLFSYLINKGNYLGFIFEGSEFVLWPLLTFIFFLF